MSFESLCIKKIKRTFTEDMIINIFWKNFLGKVYRVDFEAIVYDNGEWDFEYQKAFIYKDETSNWDKEVIKSINENDNYILYHTTLNGTNECWTMYKNPTPIPKSTRSENIHQMCHNNKILHKKIAELEEENKKLKEQLQSK